jgi:hypothetical protein
MILNSQNKLIVPSFRELYHPKDFSTITHNCYYFRWAQDAFIEENTRVFMCHFPGQDDESLGFISLIPYRFEGKEGGFVEIYLIESSYDYVGTHLVAWACKIGIELFGEEAYFFLKAVPKHEEAVEFFVRIGAEEDSIGDMIIYPEAAKKLIHECGI